MVGDTMRPRQTIERVYEEGKKRFCRVRTELLNQRGELVLEGFHLYRIITAKA